jgi:CBS domain-containing protein
MARLWEVMAKRPRVLNTVRPEETVSAAARFMAEAQVGAVLVTDSETLLGIFSERDLLRRVVVAGRSLQLRVSEVMTRDPITASPDDDRAEAVETMQRLGCRHLPIVRNHVLIDTLSIRDLVFSELEDRSYEISELNRFIRGAL